MATINIGDSFENMDWLRSFPEYEDEVAIHDALAKKLKKKKKGDLEKMGELEKSSSVQK